MPRHLFSRSTVLVLVVLAACGSDGTDGRETTQLGTLAYVETECHDTAEGFIERQVLRIRQGEREPVTVFETPGVGPIAGIGGLCGLLTQGRLGDLSITREAVQSVVVSPDGASVVFEVTDEFSVNPPLPLNLLPEQKGFFWVRADGTGLRRLGPPSRQRNHYVLASRAVGTVSRWRFSPSGRTIAFVDRGPDADGHEADQVVLIDVATGARTQVTQLPPAVPPAVWPPDGPTIVTYLYPAVFVDDRTIGFSTSANPNGLNPAGDFLLMTIGTDGLDLEVPLPIPIALPGSEIELRFVISGDRPQEITVVMPGEPSNPGDPESPFGSHIQEIFVVDEGKNALQLTNFRRRDTFTEVVDIDREHIYFTASADPLGSNPSANCQMFSIERTGAGLRQLTNFHETEHSLQGCFEGPRPRGCGFNWTYQDSRNRTLVFGSNCDPLGQNPNGYQIFAMRPDGSGLRQLTDSRGLVKEADGAYSGALPGPWAYGPYLP
jgi:hypothetical protein